MGRAQAHNALEEFHLAYEAFEKGRVLEPGNKSFQTMVAKAKELAEVRRQAHTWPSCDSGREGSV